MRSCASEVTSHLDHHTHPLKPSELIACALLSYFFPSAAADVVNILTKTPIYLALIIIIFSLAIVGIGTGWIHCQSLRHQSTNPTIPLLL